MSTPWSAGAWAEAVPVYEKILREPFVVELADGTLPREKFDFYIGQDAIYLNHYTSVLCHIASRLSDKRHVEAFVAFASTGIAVEKELHSSFVTPEIISKVKQSPSCLLYTSVEAAQALASVEVEAAAVLPCFWVYQKVGEHISRIAKPNNPYERWIATYAHPDFAEATCRAIAICDELAEAAGVETRRRMTEIFTICTRMEWLFWHSAYEMEQWKI